MTAVLQKWMHKAQVCAAELVLPDGCRDIIRIDHPNGQCEWRVTPLQAAPEIVELTPGADLTGYRLSPGSHISADFLCGLEQGIEVNENDIHHEVTAQTRSAEAIRCLSEAEGVERAARASGVSVRSLHRLLIKETGKSPIFWLRLARVRRASQDHQSPLAAVAADHGFSDQAHMAREFRHWFGLSPRALRSNAKVQHQLAQPALATGEQISTRNPLMSVT